MDPTFKGITTVIRLLLYHNWNEEMDPTFKGITTALPLLFSNGITNEEMDPTFKGITTKYNTLESIPLLWRNGPDF